MCLPTGDADSFGIDTVDRKSAFIVDGGLFNTQNTYDAFFTCGRTSTNASDTPFSTGIPFGTGSSYGSEIPFSKNMMSLPNLHVDSISNNVNSVNADLTKLSKFDILVDGFDLPQQSLKLHTPVFEFCDLCVATKCNGVIMGPPFSGKTTSLELWAAAKV